MTKDQKIENLTRIIQNTFWMARRYAHGRHTYAPGIVRKSYYDLKNIGIEIKTDDTIKPPKDNEIGSFVFRDDYLDDIT